MKKGLHCISLLLTAIIILSGCVTPSPVTLKEAETTDFTPNAVKQKTQPAVEPTPSPTPTPTPEPTIEVPPLELRTINAENAASMVQIKMLGDGRISHMAYSPSGNLLAAGSTIGIRLHGGKDLAERAFLPVSKPVRRVAFSPDGSLLAAGTEAGVILVFSVDDILSSQGETPSPIQEIKANNFPVTDLVFSPDGQSLANGSVDRTIQIWDPITGKRIRSVGGFLLGISAVAYSPDSTLLAGSSVDGSIRVWRIRTGEVLNSLGQPDKKRILPDHYPISIGFHRDGWLVSVWQSGEITTWQWQNEDSDPITTIASYEILTSAAFDPVSGKLLTSTRSGTVNIHDTETSDSSSLRFAQALTVETGEEILSMGFSPDGSQLATAIYPTGITLWDAQTGVQVKAYVRSPSGLQLAASSFSPDSRYLATSHADGLIRIWDTRNMMQYFEFQPGNGEVSRSLQFSGDGNSLLCGSDAVYSFPTGNFQQYLGIQQPAVSRTTRVDLLPDWRIETGGVVQTIALSVDQQYLASANLLGNTISLWDPATGKLLGYLEKANGPVEVLAFSPDGKTLAAGSIDHKVRFWSLDGESFTIANGEELQAVKADRILKNDFAVLTMVYSADGSQMAIAGTNWNVRVVNTLNGGLQVLLKGAKDQIISLAASPGGDLFATGGVDGLIRLYEPGNKNPLILLRGQAGMVNTLNFSPDKRMLISGGEDGTIRVWGILP